uniref:Uncharacterized protein n=1 Tax=Peronospora matthiolae TaxID=2874970 RepID=A0AAV1TJ85_9STRA
MNWMTGGKHRALYSQRGQRRQMHFPSQVQRQRVKPSSPSRSAQPAAAARARDSTTPWYIVQVGDDTESQGRERARVPMSHWTLRVALVVTTFWWCQRADIRVLELERQRAKSSKPATSQEVTGETAALEVTSDWTLDSRARLSPSHKTRRGQDAVEGRDGSSGSRCVFTPVKKARRGEQPFRAVQRLPDASGGERPLSTVASDGDTVFVNDGKELRHETQAQHTERECARRFSFETHDGRFSQHIGQNDDRNLFQHHRQSSLDKDHDTETAFDCRMPEVQQQAFDGIHGHQQAFLDEVSDIDQRYFQRSRLESAFSAGSSSDLPFDRSDSHSFVRNPYHPRENLTPSSPVAASPLSFRMSRAEGLQFLSAKLCYMTCSPFFSSPAVPALYPSSHNDTQRNSTHNRHPSPSPSPSTSTSSQGSVVLGHPPPGWQKKMLMSLNDEMIARHEDHLEKLVSFRENMSSSSVAHVVGATDCLQRSPSIFSSSPRSSTGSDSESSLINTVVPSNVKERKLAAAASQQHPPNPRMWFQRSATTRSGGDTDAVTLSGGNTVAQQRSWAMSTRTKTILDTVSSSKAFSVENATEMHRTEHQQMESVAVYMYTLVQCYKIDESLRCNLRCHFIFHGILLIVLICQFADRCGTPLGGHVQPVSKVSSTPLADAALPTPKACRREITFSPMNARSRTKVD